jgi:DNA polymerase III epsilon subunit-like protein
MSQRTNYPLRTRSFAFFDVETTGLRPDRGARICEMAVADRDGIQFEWSSASDPPGDEELAEQLLFLVDHLQGSVVVGHNLQFDFRFLTYEAERLGLGGLDVQFVDTLGLARTLFPNRDGYGLGSLLTAFNLVPEGELHTAVGDVLATRTLFWDLVSRGDLKTLADAGLKRLSWNAG